MIINSAHVTKKGDNRHCLPPDRRTHHHLCWILTICFNLNLVWSSQDQYEGNIGDRGTC